MAVCGYGAGRETMNSQNTLSLVTSEYLRTYEKILRELIEGMTGAPLTESISHNFIVQMIPHHRAAIEMSKNLLRFTTNIPLQNIALQIISEQTKSIADMEAALPLCRRLMNPPQDVRAYQNKTESIMKTMFSEMGSAPADNDLNTDFVREMIPHHMGAIRMSENALSQNICPDLVPILTAIITSQKRGVRQMEELLKKSPGKPEDLCHESYCQQITGVEPAFPAWEASVLPMNHICK